MVFQTFWLWLTARLVTYVGTQVAAMAAAIEPAAITLATIYLLIWGYLHLSGQITEPVLDGIRRIVTLGVVLGVALRLWSYHAVLTALFFDGPVELAAALVGATDPVRTVDAIWDRGGTVAGLLWEHGGVFDGNVGFYLAGSAVYVLIGAVCVYAVFLMALSRIAIALLLALGPLFIVLALFPATRQLFGAWLSQLANYALVSVLTVLVAALMLTVVEAYATQTAARGSALLTVDALNMVLVSSLVFLLFRQVMPIAARLAGGIALGHDSPFRPVFAALRFAATRASLPTSAARPAAAPIRR